jgi:hypothetical protein
MSYLRYLCIFAHSCVQHILRFVFVLFCFRLVYSMLPLSLDCPFMIVTSVFSSVYQTKHVIIQYRLQHIYTVNLAVVAKRVNRS